MNKRGLSLLEVLISMFLLGTMGSVTLATLLYSARPTKQATYREQAIYRACSQYARSKSAGLPVGDLPVTRETFDDVIFTTTVRVAEVAGYDPKDLRKLSVEVSWSNHAVQQIGWVHGTTY